jgi:hypothetical protein
MNFFLLKFPLSSRDFNVELFFWLEFGWSGIDCVLVIDLQKLKID